MGIAGGVHLIPWRFSLTFLVVLTIAPLWSALVARVPRRTLLPLVYGFFSLNLIAFYLLLRSAIAPRATADAFFVWTSVFNLMAVTVLWIFMADIFRPEQARRLFGFIAAGGSAGAIVGPLFTSSLVGRLGTANLLLVAAALLASAALCVHRLGQRAPATAGTITDAEKSGDAKRPLAAEALAGIRLMLASPYLLAMGGYTFFVTFVGTFGYYVQAHLVAAAGMTPIARTALFARVDLATNVIAIALEVLLAPRLLSRLGAGPALVALPALASLTFVVQALAPTVTASSAMQVLRRSIGYGVANPALQVLYTGVTREERYKTKAFIDTVVYRGGDVASAWMIGGLFALGFSAAAISSVAVPLAGAWLAAAGFLGRRHRALDVPPGPPARRGQGPSG